MTKKALLIGINYTKQDSNKLNGCVNDIRKMSKILVNHYSFDSITMLHDETDNPDIAPTTSNILHQLNIFTKDCKKGDTLFFHYSGHGSQIKDLNGDEDDGLDEVIIPSDFDEYGVIHDDYLRKCLVDCIPEGAKLICIFDCCHSGTILDLHYKMNKVTNVRTGNPDSVKSSFLTFLEYNYPISQGDIICISGCKDNQTSADAYIREENERTKKMSSGWQGALTYSLCKVLHKKGYNLSIEELIRETTCLLKKNRYTQTFQLSSGKNNDMSRKFII